MSLAPVAYLLSQRVVRHDPVNVNVNWISRDRFVLSAGHSSLMQSVQLFFGGRGLGLDDLRHSLPGVPGQARTTASTCRWSPEGVSIACAMFWIMVIPIASFAVHLTGVKIGEPLKHLIRVDFSSPSSNSGQLVRPLVPKALPKAARITP